MTTIRTNNKNYKNIVEESYTILGSWELVAKWFNFNNDNKSQTFNKRLFHRIVKDNWTPPTILKNQIIRLGVPLLIPYNIFISLEPALQEKIKPTKPQDSNILKPPQKKKYKRKKYYRPCLPKKYDNIPSNVIIKLLDRFQQQQSNNTQDNTK